jgi:biotin operon repressor
VHRVSVPFYRERYRLLERLAARGLRSVRDAQLSERTRFGRRAATFAHVLFPRAESIAADLYWDQIQQRVWLRGHGPYSLDDHPMVARMLEAIVAADELTIPLATLFETVWRAPYQPLIHENKAHVTLHRLRAWLDDHRKGLGRAIVVRDGIVSIADDIDVVVLEPPANLGAPDAPQLSTLDRVAAALDEESPLSARELEERLGISRTALNHACRALLEAGRITCSGQGRALLYCAA